MNSLGNRMRRWLGALRPTSSEALDEAIQIVPRDSGGSASDAERASDTRDVMSRLEEALLTALVHG